MIDHICARRPEDNSSLCSCAVAARGFSLVEFMLSTLMVLVIAAGVFGLLGQTQRTASYQTEVQGVLENTRIVMETLQRIFQQAANDPKKIGFATIMITDPQTVRVRSDLTGSAGPANPDKGDPDGDLNDSGEDITIHYNAAARTVELITPDGVAQPIASNITAFTMIYFNHNGVATSDGMTVCMVRIALTGASPYPDPQTGRIFSMEMACDVQIASRQ